MADISLDQIWEQMDSLLPKKEIPVFLPSHICTNCGYDDVCDATCGKCGLVKQHIDDSAEWRGGVSETGVSCDPSRVGMISDPLYSSNWGSGTIMKVGYRDRKKWGFVSKVNTHSSMNHKDRALHKSYGEFEDVGRKLGLQGVILIEAKAIYKELSEKVLTRGAIRVGMKANCILRACQQRGVPRTTEEVAIAYGITTTDISRTAHKMELLEKTSGFTDPADLVPRIFNTLEFGKTDREKSVLKMRSVDACRKVEECHELQGRTPRAVAVVVIYRVLTNNGIKMDKTYFVQNGEISAATFSKIDNIVKKSI